MKIEDWFNKKIQQTKSNPEEQKPVNWFWEQGRDIVDFQQPRFQIRINKDVKSKELKAVVIRLDVLSDFLSDLRKCRHDCADTDVTNLLPHLKYYLFATKRTLCVKTTFKLKQFQMVRKTTRQSPVDPLLLQIAPQASKVPLVTLKLSRHLCRVLPF